MVNAIFKTILDLDKIDEILLKCEENYYHLKCDKILQNKRFPPSCCFSFRSAITYCNLFLQRVASKRFLQSDWLQQRSITFINTFLLPRESMQIQYNTADTRRNHWWFKSLTFHTNSSTKPTLCVNSFFACSFLANSAFVRVRDLSSSFISSFLFCRSSACAPRVSDNSENMRRKGIGN